ncbi:MAG: Unknown protein [uncultured Sulfurovum sp.]|uniref:Transposase IS200-like domain-containing protein n=1 Tax=uncultured Sulfurovum sp. TaxID=269237 RepID=A0A6S6SPI2_9BACT|nr:MAG: Unknown protein [uncultured Sulfurovum sp.]
MKKYTHLAHINLVGHYQFITFRTKDSLDSYLNKLYTNDEATHIKQYKIDQYLDTSTKGAYLYDEVIDQIIEYYVEYDKALSEVIAVSIMPNHIHILLKENAEFPKIMQILKGGGSSRQIHKVLGTKGTLWSRDYENHLQIKSRYNKNKKGSL